MISLIRASSYSFLMFICLAGPLTAVDPTQRPLLDLSQPGSEAQLVPNAVDQVTVARPASGGITLVCKPGGNGYPGISIKPDGNRAMWDFSQVGHIAATLMNIGSEPITVCLRVDNAGDWKDNPWNGEKLSLTPGEIGTVVVHFGFSWGNKGFALDPAKINQVMFFVENPKKDQSFRLDSITFGGAPGEGLPLPADQVRIAPKDGILLGAGTTLDATQVVGKGVQASLVSTGGKQSVQLVIEAGKDGQVELRPAVGRWDLRDHVQVRVRVRNDGKAAVQIKAQLEGGGPTDWISAVVAAGATTELLVPFAAERIWDGSPDSGSHFSSDITAAVIVHVDHGDHVRSLIIDSIIAGATVEIPTWLGSRPPVPGEWTKTFSDEFDGTTIDQSKWNIYTANYWDERTHFSANNVLVSNGKVKLHYEKKTGFHNDDPAGKQTDYACGFLDTYGKWTQRYGYFEARFKLPRAPGLWPAFWAMPDRSLAAGEQWQRSSTGEGGMEFDIMEHLTRWGPYRFNIAHHWDGYGKDHKSNGTAGAYVGPDKDGFMTCGMLWEPGRTTYYGNGKPLLRWEDTRISSIPSYVIFDVVSGGWDNSPLNDAALPADFEIDWVRAWQHKELAELPAKP